MLLLVIDVQDGLDDPQYGERNNRQCEERIAALLAAWRSASLPVVFTQHFSRRPDSPLAESDPRSRIKETIAPGAGDRVFPKTTNSAFKNLRFASAIAETSTRDLVLVGIATDACVSATAREAKDLGYSVTLVEDACATFPRRLSDREEYSAEIVHRVCLAALAASGMGVVTTEALLRQLESARGQTSEDSTVLAHGIRSRGR